MNISNKMQFKLAELVDGLDVEIKGDPNCLISGISPIHQSKPGHITFLNNSLYRKHLESTQATAVVLTKNEVDRCFVNAVVSSNPYYVYAKIASFFADEIAFVPGMHPSVIFGKGSLIDPSASIGPYCVLGAGVKIGAQVVIGPGCAIGDDVEIGEASHLEANVSISHKVKIGKRAEIASGAVIGSDGFGFANQNGVWHKVPQLGSVDIGDDVDIGANTTIDRGAIENTVIENGVKLDNQIQVGHNVRIGANTIIAGCVAIAGSVTIGKNCMIGGGSCINGHITICDNAMFTGMCGIIKSINEPGIYASGVGGTVPFKEFCKNNARFFQLENLMKRVKQLESALKEKKEREAQ